MGPEGRGPRWCIPQASETGSLHGENEIPFPLRNPQGKFYYKIIVFLFPFYFLKLRISLCCYLWLKINLTNFRPFLTYNLWFTSLNRAHILSLYSYIREYFDIKLR